ncbi:stage II sporulation protein D [Clostridium sp.]|uniref:stage II sporulation protein D n=1 Tax=Clostridium sp. TaxID=1506 RepID=UPI003463B6F2
MKYYGKIKINLNYDKALAIVKPILTVVIYSAVLLGFLILSYKLILGEGSKIGQKVNNSPDVIEVMQSKNEATAANKDVPFNIDVDTIKVYLTKGNRIVEVPLEEYIKGVVCSEMPLNFNKEALKAQAIAARTYTLAHTKAVSSGCANGRGADLCDTVHCQVYTPKEEKIAQLGVGGESKWKLVEDVVDETKGMVLTYNNELVLGAYYFSTSSGKTENVEDVFSTALPYLRSVESLGEDVAPRYKSTETIDVNRFAQIVNSSYGDANLSPANLQNQVKINNYTDGGSVKEITLGNVTITGVKFRQLFGLNSANFSLEFLNNQIAINCNGFGHGVGMSQWGANVMASQGKSCEEILKHYYTGIEIKSINGN